MIVSVFMGIAGLLGVLLKYGFRNRNNSVNPSDKNAIFLQKKLGQDRGRTCSRFLFFGNTRVHIWRRAKGLFWGISRG